MNERRRGSLVTLTKPGGHRRITPPRPGFTLGDAEGRSKPSSLHRSPERVISTPGIPQSRARTPESGLRAAT
jgi:hypothetical protein